MALPSYTFFFVTKLNIRLQIYVVTEIYITMEMKILNEQFVSLIKSTPLGRFAHTKVARRIP